MTSTQPPTHRSGGRYPDLARLVALASRWRMAVLGAMAAAAALAALIGSHSGATYEAESRLLVGPLTGDPKVLKASGQQGQTFSQLATSQLVLDQARRQLGDRRPRSELLADVRVEASETTRILAITARADDAPTAAARANAISTELMRLVDARRPPGADNALRVVDAAAPPDEPVGSGLAVLIAAAALTGLLCALAVVLLVDYFRGRVVTEDELIEVSGVPHLATVADERRATEDEASEYRLLAGRVALAERDRRRITLVVTTDGTGGGGGRVAADLAAALAADSREVLLVDADPDRAEVTRRFGLEGREGLGELLDQPHETSDVRVAELAAEVAPRLRVVPRGSARASTGVPLEAASLALRRLARAADVVVLSPGSSSSASGLRWASLADGTIVVAHRIDTRRDGIARAVDALEQVGATVLGTVLAERPRRRLWRRDGGRREHRRLRPPSASAPPPRAEEVGGVAAG